MTLTPVQRFLAGLSLALLAVTALLFFQYLDDLGRKNDLSRRLAALQQTIDRVNAAAASGADSDPLLHTPAFPANPPNLDLASVVLSSAAASGVALGPLQATTQGTDKVGANLYRTVTMSVTVTGTLPQILDFFDRVERGGVRTLVFDNIHAEPVDGRWTVQMQLVVYAQPG